MQTADLVRPESHCYLTPFGENRWMMAFSLGERRNAIGERYRLGEVLEVIAQQQ